MDKEKTEQVTIRLPISLLEKIGARADAEHMPRATKLVQMIYESAERLDGQRADLRPSTPRPSIQGAVAAKDGSNRL